MKKYDFRMPLKKKFADKKRKKNDKRKKKFFFIFVKIDFMNLFVKHFL